MIRERVNAGLASAKAKGVKLGRRRIAPDEGIRELRSEGKGVLKRPTTWGGYQRGAACHRRSIIGDTATIVVNAGIVAGRRISRMPDSGQKLTFGTLRSHVSL